MPPSQSDHRVPDNLRRGRVVAPYPIITRRGTTSRPRFVSRISAPLHAPRRDEYDPIGIQVLAQVIGAKAERRRREARSQEADDSVLRDGQSRRKKGGDSEVGGTRLLRAFRGN